MPLLDPRRWAIQTWSMLVDAYRELRHRRLFWITLAISGFVAAAFAAVGLTENGVKILVWEFGVPFLNTRTMSVEFFYKALFMELGVRFWLAWVASILALVSTASLFPDFLAGGTVDLWMSKPISRARLFLTKYALGLLFVALQVGVFTTASFFVLGLRGGTWEPAVFLAIPLVVCFFSYLFAFCVLFGVVTRSTIAALLLTLLVWFGLFLVNKSEETLMRLATIPKIQIDDARKRIDVQRRRPAPDEARIRDLEAGIGEAESSARTLEWWQRWALRVKTVFPKTDETIELLQRRLIALADLPAPPDEPERDGWEGREARGELPFGNREPVNQAAIERRVMEQRRERSPAWVLGTSLAFEALVVAAAMAVFCRRDY